MKGINSANSIKRKIKLAFAIRKHNKRLHILCMLGAYIGTVISVAVAASTQGRLLNDLLF